ncbi:unnamed protein product [Symbiodinium natans]|uniref:Uncharacterized protein n=1 Tax=Symbiodinium natans TaxID=878477 RepID=A0A812SSD6_9DINO|nr:unnamed protein product [Symbiodinium natans]
MVGADSWNSWRRNKGHRGRPRTVEPRVCKEEWKETRSLPPWSSWSPPWSSTGARSPPFAPRPPPGPPPEGSDEHPFVSQWKTDRWAHWADEDCEPEPAPSLASQSTSATSLPAVKRELSDDTTSSSDEDQPGQFLSILNRGPPKPKKMPKKRPMPPTSVATSKYAPPKRSSSAMAPPQVPDPKRLRLEEPERRPPQPPQPRSRTIIRPSTKAGPAISPTSKPPPPSVQPAVARMAPTAPAPPVIRAPLIPAPPAQGQAPAPAFPVNGVRIGTARAKVSTVPPRVPRRLTRETSTGLMVDPPPMADLRDSRPCPLPGPPPMEDPPYWALDKPFMNSQLALPPSHLPLALPAPPLQPPPPPVETLESERLNMAAPMTDALALCEAPSGEGTISIDIDEGAVAVADLLQQEGHQKKEFLEAIEALKEFQRKAAKAFKGSNAPLTIDVRVGGAGADLADLELSPGGPSVGSSGYYSNKGNWSDALPASLAAERVVDASDIRFSQRSMKRRFQDGRSLEELILGLMRGTYNSMTDEFLKLTVVEKSDSKGNPALYSKDNRRLYCLQEYQRRIGRADVPVRVRILAWQDVVDACKFQRNYDTEMDGVDIVLR